MKTMFGIAVVMFVVLGADAVTAQETTVDVGPFANWFLNFILPTVTTLITVAVGYAVKLFKDKTGIEIEAQHRDALQTALTNAASLAIRELGDRAKDARIDFRHAGVAKAVGYVMEATPDAVANFGLTPDKLAEKVVAKIEQQSEHPPLMTVQS